MLKALLAIFSPSQLVGITTFLTYFILLLINPNKKIIVLAYGILLLIYFLISRQFTVSLFLIWLASSIIGTGKEYRFELVPPGLYPIEIFPYGVTQIVNITPNLIISICIALFLITRLVKNQLKLRLSHVDLLILAIYLWQVLKDFLWSKNPFLSIILSGQGLFFLAIYFLLQDPVFQKKPIFSYIKHLILGLIMFESVLIGFQIINNAPLYSNLETQVTREYFGHTADEKNLPFRPVGTLSHANFLGLWLAIYLIFIIALIAKDQNTPITSLTILLVSAGIMSTLSRSTWIGIGFALIFLLYAFVKIKKIDPLPHLKSKIPVLLLITIPILSVYFFPRLVRSLHSFDEGGGVLRTDQNAETIELIKTFPLTGVGTGQSLVALRELNPSGVFARVALTTHNWYLLYAAENGLIGLLLWFVVIGITIKKYWTDFKQSSFNLASKLKLGWLAMIICMGAFALFQPQINDSMIIMSIGLISAIEKKYR